MGAKQCAGGGVRLGIDFGTTLTKVAVTNEGMTDCYPLALPSLSRQLPGAGTGREVPVVPSLIHFTATGTSLVGAEVIASGTLGAGSTAACLKHYLLTDSPVQVPAGDGTQCSAREAGRHFLHRVLTAALTQCECQPTQVVFTLPVDAPPHYEDWIASVAAAVGIRFFYVLDECSAVMLGMGVPLVTGRPVLIVDIGGVSCTVTIGMPDELGTSSPQSIHSAHFPTATGCRIRVVGSARSDCGGAEIDAWLSAEVESRYRQGNLHEQANRHNGVPVVEYERAKELLSVKNEVDMVISSANPTRHTCIDRELLEQIMKDRGFFSMLDHTINRALAAARMRGYTIGDISTVVLAGGCAAIPAVLDAVRHKFPRCPVVCDRPEWAAVRGAVVYTPGTLTSARIRNDYAIRYWDPVTLTHGYRFLVRGGTPYPSAGQVARLIVSAAYDGQTHLGIPLYEYRNGNGQAPCHSIELVAATGGGLRCADAATTPSNEHPPVLVNERVPMFLVADPPAKKGEPRFEVTFTIDGTKQLAVTARDVQTGRLVKDAMPLFRLT